MDFLFVSLFILIPVLIFLILHLSGFSPLKVGLIQFVVISIFFFAFFGILPLYFGWDDYRAEFGVNNKLLLIYVMLFSGWTMLSMTLGAAFSKILLSRLNLAGVFENVVFKPIERVLFIIILVFVCLVLYDYLSKIPKVAILVALLDSVTESKVARSGMGNDFSGKYHWYSLVIHNIANFLSYAAFAFYLISRKYINLFIFITAFMISAFTSLMATEKAPFAWLLIGHFMTYVIIRHKGAYPVKKLIYFFALIIFILALLYMYFMGSTNIGLALLSVYSRAFAGSIQPAYHYLEFFPAHKDFLLGSSFPNPGGFLPFEPYLLAQEVMSFFNPDDAIMGVVGSMPTVFWGEAYANYGIFGVIFIPFFVGFCLYLVDVFISFTPNTSIKYGFYVWLLLHYKNLSVTGFSAYIIDFNLIFMFVLFSFCLIFTRKIKLY